MGKNCDFWKGIGVRYCIYFAFFFAVLFVVALHLSLMCYYQFHILKLKDFLCQSYIQVCTVSFEDTYSILLQGVLCVWVCVRVWVSHTSARCGYSLLRTRHITPNLCCNVHVSEKALIDLLTAFSPTPAPALLSTATLLLISSIAILIKITLKPIIPD